MLKKLGSVFLVSTLLFATSCGSGGGGTRQVDVPGQGGGVEGLRSKVNHVIFTFQENRSFDNYFGQLNAYRTARGLGADVDGLDRVNPQPPSNPTRDGLGTITSFEMVSACTSDVSPGWNESHTQRNLRNPTITNPPLMDGFVSTAAAYAERLGEWDVAGQRAMGYYDDTILPYYYYMATQFATSDRFFSALMAKSEPNYLYALAATSAGHVTIPDRTLSQKTIFHLLQEAGVSWKVYTRNPNGNTALRYFQPFASQHEDRIVPIDQYFADLRNGNLPAVAFIQHQSGQDEHPGANVQTGAKATADIINAFMRSQYWNDSIFLMAYDEGGGLYDHVPPMQTVSPDGIPPILTVNNPNTFGDNFTLSGFRVPLLVISPFTRKGYVSHTPMDFTAFLKLIQTRWSLPSLTARDAAQPDMTEFFNFDNPPQPTPPTDVPSQPTSAPCYRNALP